MSEGINYKIIKLGENAQIKGNDLTEEAQNSKNEDYSDGLSVFDLEGLDSNKDGIVTKDEATGLWGSYPLHAAGIDKIDDINAQWNEYFSAYQDYDIDFENDNSDETKGLQAKASDITNEKFDNGNLISYDIKAKKSDGKEVIVKRTVENGKIKETIIEDDSKQPEEESGTGETKLFSNDNLKPAAGSTIKKNKLVGRYSTEDGTTIESIKDSAAGKTIITLNKDGLPTSINITNGNKEKGNLNFNLSNMEYDGSGELTKITIGDKEYTSENIKKTEKGNVITTDSGKLVIKKPNKEGVTKIINCDKDGKKLSSLALDKNKTPMYTIEYDGNEKAKAKYFANSERIREYTRGDNGNLLSSVDFKYNANGEKETLSEQAYTYNEDLGKYVWSKSTTYSNGEESGTKEYDYKKSEDGNITCTRTDKDINNKPTGEKVSIISKTEPRRYVSETKINDDGSKTVVMYDETTGIKSTKTETKDGQETTYNWVYDENSLYKNDEGKWKVKATDASKGADGNSGVNEEDDDPGIGEGEEDLGENEGDNKTDDAKSGDKGGINSGASDDTNSDTTDDKSITGILGSILEVVKEIAEYIRNISNSGEDSGDKAPSESGSNATDGTKNNGGSDNTSGSGRQAATDGSTAGGSGVAEEDDDPDADQGNDNPGEDEGDSNSGADAAKGVSGSGGQAVNPSSGGQTVNPSSDGQAVVPASKNLNSTQTDSKTDTNDSTTESSGTDKEAERNKAWISAIEDIKTELYTNDNYNILKNYAYDAEYSGKQEYIESFENFRDELIRIDKILKEDSDLAEYLSNNDIDLKSDFIRFFDKFYIYNSETSDVSEVISKYERYLNEAVTPMCELYKQAMDNSDVIENIKDNTWQNIVYNASEYKEWCTNYNTDINQKIKMELPLAHYIKNYAEALINGTNYDEFNEINDTYKNWISMQDEAINLIDLTNNKNLKTFSNDTQEKVKKLLKLYNERLSTEPNWNNTSRDEIENAIRYYMANIKPSDGNVNFNLENLIKELEPKSSKSTGTLSSQSGDNPVNKMNKYLTELEEAGIDI